MRRNAGIADVAVTRFTPLFEHFRDELDEHHDRKDRIVRASRDITAFSKKIIFSLHRAKTLKQPLPAGVQSECDSRFKDIEASIRSIEADLQGLNRHRYQWQLRCLEELVEALSLAQYVQHQTLISPEAVAAAIPANVLLTERDYIYGLFDLFGEMMRFATVTTAHTGVLAGSDLSSARNILTDIHELSGCFETMPPINDRAYTQKMEVMRESVKKVERLGYSLAIRRAERPTGWVPDLEDDGPPASGD